jgi:hypothetical protein
MPSSPRKRWTASISVDGQCATVAETSLSKSAKLVDLFPRNPVFSGACKIANQVPRRKPEFISMQ